MNILYIHSHDTGRYVQPYGYPVPTPNMQRLAEQGLVFRQAFCAHPTCSPSRGALLTGTYPHTNGLIGLAHLGFSLNDYRQHLLHTLREAGYFCALSGIQHIDGGHDDVEVYGRRIGYDVILDKHDVDGPLWNRPLTAQRAADFLLDAPPQPFFLAVGFQETHRVFPDPSPEYDPAYCRPPAPFPDTPETRRDMAGFKTSARILDEKMGIVFDALEQSNLAENTLVICTTDHGISFPGMKCTLTDRGTGVMLIMRGPHGFAGGRVIDAMVSQMDLFPTICDLLDIQPPEWLQGDSLMPLVRGERADIHDALFMELNYHVNYEPKRAVRTQRWKYIRRFDGRNRVAPLNTGMGPTMELWMEHGLLDREVAAEQLYDLFWDPNEVCNLAGDSRHQATLDAMRSRLDMWMDATDDPLRHGNIAAPEGARVVPADQLSRDAVP